MFVFYNCGDDGESPHYTHLQSLAAIISNLSYFFN